MPGSKPWWAMPGECHDAKGVPVHPGDLIRSFHFRGKRRKAYFLYHVAVFNGEYMRMVPTTHLQPGMEKGGGSCLLSQNLLDNAEVIDGHGPGKTLSYEDRPRVKIVKGNP